MSSPMSSAEKKLLLGIARESVVSCVTGKPLPDIGADSERLLAKTGCFVTIKMDGALRGCLGQLTPDKPLVEQVRDMAAAAATRDPRFYPMKKEDLDRFTLEISVLSPLKKISSPEEIQVGRHGIYIEKNFYRGVLLPQVAIEYGWDRDTFLQQTCLKAGLDSEAWQDEADIYVFNADVLSEA